MRNIALGARDLLAIVEALRLQISVLEQQRAALNHEERNDDQRSDLTNDLGFLAALVSHLEDEVQLELKSSSG